MDRVVPGDKVGTLPACRPGEYTVCRGNDIYATVIGTKHQTTDTVSIVPTNTRSMVPQPNQIVLCRITKVTPRFAGVDILATSHGPTTFTKLPYPFKATIRSHDIYNVEERDPPSVYDSFRPTDLVTAQVIGLGDTSTGLLLSTGTRPELGVVQARSVGGGKLLPVAWNEMVCDRTGLRERRKVAKPSPQ